LRAGVVPAHRERVVPTVVSAGIEPPRGSRHSGRNSRVAKLNQMGDLQV
jgi:hypothetical protein